MRRHAIGPCGPGGSFRGRLVRAELELFDHGYRALPMSAYLVDVEGAPVLRISHDGPVTLEAARYLSGLIERVLLDAAMRGTDVPVQCPCCGCSTNTPYPPTIQSCDWCGVVFDPSISEENI